MQWVTTRLLVDLWRIMFKTDARDSLAGIDKIGLWESPTGLYFFDPPLEGDQKFYRQFYSWVRRRRLLHDESIRTEFLIAAKQIPSGARVLDVGCGPGHFRKCIPEAEYVGLDPHFGAEAGTHGVSNETLGQHLVQHAASYDTVCSFQVIEHVRDPKALFAEIVEAAKPGGLICIAAPHVPSALTRIPNFLMNAPPHHLTWWSKKALVALAASAGAVVESVEIVPWGKGDSLIYWIERCSPIKAHDVHFRGALKWHAASAVAHLLGAVAYKLFGAPATSIDEGPTLLMIARRPLVTEGSNRQPNMTKSASMRTWRNR